MVGNYNPIMVLGYGCPPRAIRDVDEEDGLGRGGKEAGEKLGKRQWRREI